MYLFVCLFIETNWDYSISKKETIQNDQTQNW